MVDSVIIKNKFKKLKLYELKKLNALKNNELILIIYIVYALMHVHTVR